MVISFTIHQLQAAVLVPFEVNGNIASLGQLALTSGAR